MNDNKKRQVPISLSVPTYLVMLVGTVLVVFRPISGSELLMSICYFPLGLGALCGLDPDNILNISWIISGASFVAFLVFFIRARSWKKYGVICVSFAVFLLLNILGWVEAFKDPYS